MENIIREIKTDDYYNGYLDLMFEFTNYKYDINYEEFSKYLDSNQSNIKIIVIYSNIDKKIIGAGTIFIHKKIHNNPIGYIEDIIVTKKHQFTGLGKILIKKLTMIGKDTFKCYKIILNCSEDNIKFYEKCSFIKSGKEMKFIC